MNAMTGSHSASPMAALRPMAAGAPTAAATAPNSRSPSGVEPIHNPKMPTARPRIPGAADSKMMVLCIVLNPALPSPTPNRRTNDNAYQGEAAKARRLTNSSSAPRAKMRP